MVMQVFDMTGFQGGLHLLMTMMNTKAWRNTLLFRLDLSSFFSVCKVSGFYFEKTFPKYTRWFNQTNSVGFSTRRVNYEWLLAKLGDSTKVNVIARKFLGSESVILHHSTVAVCRQRVRSRNEDSSQLMIGLLTETSVIGSVLVAPSPWQSEADGFFWILQWYSMWSEAPRAVWGVSVVSQLKRYRILLLLPRDEWNIPQLDYEDWFA